MDSGLNALDLRVWQHFRPAAVLRYWSPTVPSGRTIYNLISAGRLKIQRQDGER